MNFETLRQQYPDFIYDNFLIEEDDYELKITYHFIIKGLSEFKPQWVIKKADSTRVSKYKIIKECIFNLGMVELISYWKLTCSKNVYINTANLDDYQINWWKKLYYYGLGEFFYLNNIKTTMNNLMNIKTVNTFICGDEYNEVFSGNLIPVGGGKDSFVTLELLKDYYDENHTFVINNVKSAIASSYAAGYKEKLINVSRSLDKNMLSLNNKGYLNGHTPFSALVAFSSLLVSLLYKKSYICLSNEASANESTILNEDVNHQYSKSYEFEYDFNEYISKYITNKVKYFSLLRALSELEITAIFSKLDKYHSIFKSCNVNSKHGTWCNHCAKCLFVYVMLSAYLNDEKLTEIFSANLLEDESLYETLKELSGLSKNKPFECVGTRDEVKTAITKAVKLRKNNLPVLYQKYLKDNGQLIDENIFTYFNEENFIPDIYVKLLKDKLEEFKNE